MGTGETYLRTSRLGRRFGRRWAVRNVELDVRRGEIYGFIGKNGAGKTTVLRMLAGLLRPSEGQVAFEEGGPQLRLGFLPQSARLAERSTAAETIAFFARARSADAAPAFDRARRIEIDLERPTGVLSPGMQRKLQIVIATIGDPPLLVLDEPTAGLDPVGIAQFRSLAAECAGRGAAVLVSSHALSELDRLCRRVAIIDSGRVVYQGAAPSRVRIETSAVDEKCLAALRRHLPGQIRLDREGLLLDGGRECIPSVVRALVEHGVDVFGAHVGGLESFFREVLEGAQP